MQQRISSFFVAHLLKPRTGHLFNVAVGDYDDILLQAFKNTSLVNSTFLHLVRRHCAHLFSTRTFTSPQRIADYIYFVQRYPESSIINSVRKLSIFLNEDKARNWEGTTVVTGMKAEKHGQCHSANKARGCKETSMVIAHAYKHENALCAFLTKEVLPNLEELVITGSEEVTTHSSMFEFFGGNNIFKKALLGIKDLPSLQVVDLSMLLLPVDIFDEKMTKLKSLKWSNITSHLNKFVAFPEKLETLHLHAGKELWDAHRAIVEYPAAFSTVSELCLRGHGKNRTIDIAWSTIRALKGSIQKLELHPELEDHRDPLQIMELTKLELLTIVFAFRDGESSEDMYIKWLSHIFSPVSYQLSASIAKFTLQIIVHHTTDFVDNEQRKCLTKLDNWMEEFCPVNLSAQVIIQIHKKIR